MTAVRQLLRRAAYGSAAAVLVLAVSMGDVNADPAADALSKLNDLSAQAVQTREAVTAAQRDADARLAEQTAAEDRHRADLAAVDAANAQLAPLQDVANRVAAMTYMSGRDGPMAAVLTAASPQQLIDRLSLQRVVAATTADQMKEYRSTRERAAAAAAASERSAADARAAAERAAAVRADLQAKWSELLRQIAAAEAQYAALTPQQQAVIDNAVPPPPPPAAPTPQDPAIVAMPGLPPGDIAPPPLAAAIADIPEALPVGVAVEAGLQPNAILAARAVSRQFPQIADIDGVRPDSKPWHPSGLAIDIMIPNHDSPEGVALGDQILAFAMSNAGRFGLQDVIWRGTYYTPAGPQASGYGHYDHVHITVTPRR
ncbi:glycoside hydrolase [Mycolicibacterium austroafricanum]|uniref:Glycoside hydrolase n=1 Tax=Mycolicibacterium austroafricanum TaxID=39687 RepID=A0ABT8HPJ7_MYCAO|nr:glycoside hydrolase [Mycolicibacterium austroafricanum]MDN4522690.1 glycoside hydrolase [Mycolicibacterium austroafricanum]QRZ06955.1 glycoside hydrolase [Mycolicibacterium austroafricanum]QZT68438.1 glycoside hydrolase [Mycolicibacterium austroafricanum]